MSQKLLDERTIKLHRSESGEIWWVDGVYPPKNSTLQIDPFLNTIGIFGRHAAFRLLGTKENAELISSLYLRRHRGEIASVEVAGKNNVPNYDKLAIEQILFAMRRIAAPAPCGGWHQVSFYDYATYSLIARLYRNKFVVDDFAANYLRVHPVFKALSFIQNLNFLYTTQVVAEMVDPRWFVDSRRPESPNKLNLYFGLTPKTQERVADKNYVLRRAREIRCSCVLSAWKTQDPNEVNLADPRNFLYRVWYSAGGSPNGDLRASQCFLQYLCQNWLAAISLRPGVKDGLFAPNLFFKMPDEIEAFTEYMAKSDPEIGKNTSN